MMRVPSPSHAEDFTVALLDTNADTVRFLTVNE